MRNMDCNNNRCFFVIGITHVGNKIEILVVRVDYHPVIMYYNYT